MIEAELGIMCRAQGNAIPCALARHAELFLTVVADIQAQRTGTVKDDCASMCNANMRNSATSVDVLHQTVLADIACMIATPWC